MYIHVLVSVHSLYVVSYTVDNPVTSVHVTLMNNSVGCDVRSVSLGIMTSCACPLV